MVVVVRSGRVEDRVTTRLNVHGIFHADVDVKAGAGIVELRILGPGKLDSGPARDYRIVRR